MKSNVILREAALADRPAVENLLTELKLPVAGVVDWLDRFWIAEADGRIVGVAGVEIYRDGALLRSVAVHPGWRSGGLGRTLVDRALDGAKRAGVRDVFLLTTTAERYFPQLGFEGITREAVPPGVQGSIEFREACPASAVVMRRTLGDG
jgi:amino-acid N-acetyltransferase